MRSRRSDRGVALVEAAFAIPVMFLFISGIIDLGMWAYNSNQAANAARDGARVGIIDYETADVAGSPSHEAIVDAIEAHLPGRSIAPSQIAVSCVDAGGTPLSGGCTTADPAEDRLRVEVGWTWDLVTPLAGAIGVDAGAADGAASMVILGLPLPATSSSPSTTTPATSTTSTPSPTSSSTTTTTSTTLGPACTISGLGTNPTSVESKNSGALDIDVTVSFQANGSGCVGLSVQIVAPDGSSATRACGCGIGPSMAWTYDKNADHFWSDGTATVRVFRRASMVATTAFEVT